MKKRCIYLNQIELSDQIEDKINKYIPIKTEESLSYFKTRCNKNINMNDYYFFKVDENQINYSCKQRKISDNFKRNFEIKKNDINLTKRKKIFDLKNSKKEDLNSKRNINQKRINKNNEEKKTLNHNLNNLSEETIAKIIKPRKILHKIYNKEKKVVNHSFKNVTYSLFMNKIDNKDTKKETNKLNHNKKHLDNINKLKNTKIKKIEYKKTKKMKLDLYDPKSKTLRYKHYTENKYFVSGRNQTIQINNSKYLNNEKTTTSNINNNFFYFDNYINTISYNDIKIMNNSLVKHRKENEKNLIRLKKLLFNNKNKSDIISNNPEESKPYYCQNSKIIYKIQINEKIKNLIENQRKKLEDSIDEYNNKLKNNYNRKAILFEIYNQSKYQTNLTETNTKNPNDNDDSINNMNILKNFYFERGKKM